MPSGNAQSRITRPRRGLRWKILFLILSIPVFLLLTEILLTIIPIDTYFQNRFFLVNRALDYPEVFKKDYHLFWRLRPSQTIRSRFFENKEYRINSHGLRGDEIPLKADRPRIIALGNSCTFGWGVRYDQTYIRQLGKLINSERTLPEITAINAAVPGYSSFQGRRFFISDITKLEPDIVLIMFAWNDQWAAAANIPDKEQQPPPEYIISIQNLLSQLEIYRLFKKLLLSAVEEPLGARLIRENPVYRVDLVDFYDNLNVIVQYCKREGIVPVLLTSPVPLLEKYYPPGSRSIMHKYHEQYNRQTRLLARATGTPLIDIAREFDRHDRLFDDAPEDPIHFNAQGHRVAAQAIYDFIIENSEKLDKK